MTDKNDPFEFPPAGKVRFIDVPDIEQAEKPTLLTTGWHSLQAAMDAQPMPRVFHITCPPIPLGSCDVAQLRIGQAYAYMVEQRSRLWAVVYEGGLWVARTLNGTFIQRWGAPPTRRQLRDANRLLQAQRRLSAQLAEIQNAQVPESH
jgi:hypothetical protein